jgi:hypothetical protein
MRFKLLLAGSQSRGLCLNLDKETTEFSGFLGSYPAMLVKIDGSTGDGRRPSEAVPSLI